MNLISGEELIAADGKLKQSCQELQNAVTRLAAGSRPSR